MKFNFFSPVKIVFGPGSSEHVFPLAAEMGQRAFVVTGKNPGRAAGLFSGLEKAGISYQVYSQTGEPYVEQVALGAEQARKEGAEFIIAQGGGSVLDAGKAIAALVTNQRDIFEYLEVIGKGEPLAEKPVPLVVLPTTSGTGAEATCNAVLGSRDHGVKVSLRSPFMYPDTAVIDPELAVPMPRGITAFTGMDALTQLIEAFVSRFAAPFTDALCREGLSRVARSFRKAFDNGDEIDARSDMCLASLLSGIALANAKLGAVHGIAGPMGGMVEMPHGLICARLLAPVMEANLKQLTACCPDSPVVLKLREIARILTADPHAGIHDGIAWIKTMAEHMKIPGFSAFGFDAAMADLVAGKSLKASSMKGNPVRFTRGQISDILLSCGSPV